MGKKSRVKARKKWTRLHPDEVFSVGPLMIERYGKSLRFSNNATPKQHAELLEITRKRHEKIKHDLPEEIEKLQLLVSAYEPVSLMHRAAYEVLPLLMKYKSENEYESDETLNLPSLEYIQYLIARTVPNNGDKEVSEEDWERCWKQAIKVVRLTGEYIFTRKSLSDPPSTIEELRVMIDGRRLGVRIERYSFFLIDHWRSALSPYEPWLQKAYGVGAEEIIRGLSEIDSYQKTGTIGRYKDALSAIDALMGKLAKLGFDLTTSPSQEELNQMKQALAPEERKKLEEDIQEKGKLAFTPAIFDITEVTSLSPKVLSLLSIKPGEAVPPLDQEHNDLDPLSVSVFHHKPFLEVSGRFYYFYHSGFEDHVVDIIESDLNNRFPEKISVLSKRKSEEIEVVSKKLLESLITPDFSYQNVFYPNPDKPGDLTELDVIMGVDDVLFIIEVKAGGFSESASRGALKSIEQELSDLIIKGQHQSERAEKYIKESEHVNFFDQTGKNVLFSIKESDFRKIFRIIVTREGLGWVGAKIAVLSVLDPGLSRSYPWHVSLDDLRVVADLFQGNPLGFVHFLERRLAASSEVVLTQHDEIEHIALYNSMNFYHEVPFKDVSRLTYDASFMRSIDVYFAEKTAGRNPEVPTQDLPVNIKLLLSALKESRQVGRFEVASVVLSMDGEIRKEIDKKIAFLLDGIGIGRQRSMRLPAPEVSTGLTITCCSGQQLHEELIRSAAMMERGSCNHWLVVQIENIDGMRIGSISKVSPGMFSEAELSKGRAGLEENISKMVDQYDIGRNDQCPCGSEKKYKKCHGL